MYFEVYLNAQHFPPTFNDDIGAIQEFYQNFSYDANGNLIDITSDGKIISQESS